MNILIIDLECTCDEPQSFPREEMEIIEIGAVALQLSPEGAKPVDEKQLYFKPVIHPTLSRFCTELTHITQPQVDEAVELPAALQALEQWADSVDALAWGSWGKFDATQLEMEARVKGVATPLQHLPHLNIKQRFAKSSGHRVGIGRALKLSSLEFIGQPHSGLDDARNVARLLDHDLKLRQAVLKRVAATRS